jgi:hypothetical protein
VEHLLAVLLLVRLDHYSSKINNMATYGRGQMLGSGINPESFKQDYSGFARAAETQAQGMANLGASISGVIKDFGEQKKEQKKVDAYNKASSKAIEAAITLGKSYDVQGVEDTLTPFLEAYSDPNLSPIEKAALLDEGKAMISNVFGRFDAKQEAMARNASSLGRVNLQQGEITETINGQQYKIPITFNPATGETRRLDGSLVGGGGIDPNTIDNALDFPTADETPNLEIGVYPNHGSSFDEAMVLPELGDPDAIAAAVELTGGQSDVSNVSPMPWWESLRRLWMPPGTPTMTETPAIDTLPIDQEGSTPTALPPGATPVENPQERAITEEERKKFNLPIGQYIATFEGKNASNIRQLDTPPDSMEKLRENRMLKADERIATVIESTDTAAEKLVTMNAALSLLNSGEVKSGALASYKVAALRLFGQDVASEEQFNSLVGNLAMEAIDLTKGAISDKEMTFFREELAPGIRRSVEGNKKILEFKIKAAERGLRINEVVRDMLAKNALPSDIENAIRKIQEEDSLIPSNTSSTSSTPDEPMSATERYKAKIKAK